MPMSSSAVINRTEVLELVDQLQATLQDALSSSDRMFGDRDAFLDESRREAERIVDGAHRASEELLSETDVYKIARRESDRLRSDA